MAYKRADPEDHPENISLDLFKALREKSAQPLSQEEVLGIASSESASLIRQGASAVQEARSAAQRLSSKLP